MASGSITVTESPGGFVVVYRASVGKRTRVAHIDRVDREEEASLGQVVEATLNRLRASQVKQEKLTDARDR